MNFESVTSIYLFVCLFLLQVESSNGKPATSEITKTKTEYNEGENLCLIDPWYGPLNKGSYVLGTYSFLASYWPVHLTNSTSPTYCRACTPSDYSTKVRYSYLNIQWVIQFKLYLMPWETYFYHHSMYNNSIWYLMIQSIAPCIYHLWYFMRLT